LVRAAFTSIGRVLPAKITVDTAPASTGIVVSMLDLRGSGAGGWPTSR
jgi:hypothetical protein